MRSIHIRQTNFHLRYRRRSAADLLAGIYERSTTSSSSNTSLLPGRLTTAEEVLEHVEWVSMMLVTTFMGLEPFLKRALGRKRRHWLRRVLLRVGRRFDVSGQRL